MFMNRKTRPICHGRIDKGNNNKPKIRKKIKKTYGGREDRENETKQQQQQTNKHFVKRKRRQEMSASNVTKAGYT